MQIIPAIDIKDSHCVRLRQGDMQSVTVFSEDPAAMAQHWLEQGAERLHLVDLNGAVAGKPKNELAIREIVSVIGEEIPVQLGGGIRDLDTIERYLDDGITYVVIGTERNGPDHTCSCEAAISGRMCWHRAAVVLARQRSEWQRASRAAASLAARFPCRGRVRASEVSS